MIRKIYISLVLIIGMFLSSETYATHLRAGEIIVKRVDCTGRTFEVTVIVYTDSEPLDPVLFGMGELRFGDESSPDDFFNSGGSPSGIPEIQNNTHVTYNSDGTLTIEDISEDLGPGVSLAKFTVRHTYSSNGKFTVSYLEPNRNAGILNIEAGNSVNTRFYIETEIRIDGFLGCNNTPELLIPPIDRGCTGVAFYHNPGAFDPDGDSLSFELVTPKKSVGTNVSAYISPADPSFYENFSQGNENGDGPPTFKIDPITGEIEWNSPGTVGEYNIAFIVKEWRFKGGEWLLLGFVTRDMQIIVEDCDNERPELEIPFDICVEAGETINEIIYGTDPDNHDVKIEAYSQVIENLGAIVSPIPPEFLPSSPAAQLQFTWQTECLDIRDQPYQVVFKITDNPPLGPKLVSFATWNITVVGPSPDLLSVDQDGQALLLNWDSYLCQNAELIQVWRRVDSNPYEPDECETGMRENAGYSLIAEVPVTRTSFRDTNLAAAAKYCYRLVAQYPDVPGGESIVSNELCFEYVPADEPIITHVTVEQTDTNTGRILVAWRAPFEFGTFPVDTVYRVYRAEGFSGTNYELITEIDGNGLDSIAYRDTNLDTENKVYNYKIALLDPSSSTGVDEVPSAPASSVRLEITPQFGQIRLDWAAVVPWSNTIVNPPNNEHLIFRGLEGQSQNEFVLLKRLDVTQFGFSFIDSVNLVDEQVYCYRVETKGTYGNPAINSPQLNFSQIICGQPSDSIPPCKPVVTIDGPSCEDSFTNIGCGFNDFKNRLSWSTELTAGCENDVKFYEVYYASTSKSEFELIAEVTDTTYLHENLTSFKGCYQVRAVDRSGNVGEFSDPFCVDNCPYYELPNVFTPGDGACNERFSAYSDRVVVDENGVSDNCGQIDRTKCARFVRSVKFTVFNRWGSPVYTYTGRAGTENSIYIDWNGVAENGSELPSAVYYYSAEVTFDVVNPDEATKLYKGWIHLLR